MQSLPDGAVVNAISRQAVKEAQRLATEGKHAEAAEIMCGEWGADYDKAISTVYHKPRFGQPGFEKKTLFQQNMGRIAAFKANTLERSLRDPGEEKADGIIKRFNRWQAVEHNTVIARARSAKQFEQFGSVRDLYPNIEWLRTGSANPRELYLNYVGLVLPQDHQFWQSNQPGNLYGCKCNWRTTDRGTSAEPIQTVEPSPGLDGNPAETGEIISDRHPYVRNADRKQVNQFMASMKSEITYREALSSRGKPIRWNIMHGRDALLKNIEVANGLLKYREFTGVDILPELHPKDAAQRVKFLPSSYRQRNPQKNPEAILHTRNGKRLVTEFKVLESINNIGRHITLAAAQANYAVLKLDFIPETDIYDNVKLRVDRKMKESPELKGVIVLDIRHDVVYKTGIWQ
ncbi:MAG: hypothetical protein LBH06_00880 [Rikenellaceae bacterium]|nr:hypothetical protein [Rikenellaceae bacterium]